MSFIRVSDPFFNVTTSSRWKYKSKKYFAMAEGSLDNPTFDPEDPEVPANDDHDNEDEQSHDETTPL